MSGRVVVLTGCTRGIGRALFEWFVAQGFRVAGCGTDRLQLDALSAASPQSLVSQVDVRDEAAVETWLRTISGRFGPINLLICSAGVLPAPGSLWETPAGDWSQACEVNILGTARVLRHAVPHLRAPGATAVLVTSRYGRAVVRGQGCYSATKWAAEAMAKTLALELRDRGVVVVSLDPGVVDTGMLRRSSAGAAEWCSAQRGAGDFAAEAGPFLLSLTAADTGRNLTCPGSPPHYFQTGVDYKDRPAWANGFGAFVRARDDEAATVAAAQPGGDAAAAAAKRRCLSNGEPSAMERAADPEPVAIGSVKATAGGGGALPRRYFISGVMLGSRHQLKDASVDLVSQDYRGRIAQAIRKADPAAEVVEPLEVVRVRAAAAGRTLEELSREDSMVREAFGEVVELSAQCDVVISNLPEASMGSAVELWEAKKAGRTVLTVSPMVDNWLLRSVTDHNFLSLEDLERDLAAHLPRRAVP